MPLIILLATLENFWPIIAGYMATPKGDVFLGTVHHPEDFFYYLSQFAQGATRWLTTKNLYTSENIPPTFVGWSNVLLGHLFSAIGVPPIGAYIISIFILSVLLLTAAYYLSLVVLKSRTKATIALYLFAIYHAFPILDNKTLAYSDYWNNYAVPRVRLGGVPHQILIGLLSILIMSGIIAVQKITGRKRTVLRLFGLSIASFALASLQPVLWVIITITSGLSALIYGSIKRLNIKQLSIFCLPIFFVCIGGIIPALYLSHLFTTLPFIQLKLWEAVQHNDLAPVGFFLSIGPIFLIAILSLPSYLSKISFTTLLIFLFSLFSFALFLSPIQSYVGITHVRFMSTLVILCIAIVAADGIHTFSTIFMPKIFPRPSVNPASPAGGRELFTVFLVCFLTLILLPSHIASMTQAAKFNPNDAYQYLSTSDYEFLRAAGTYSQNERDLYLIIWPYNVVFPALTGRQSFNGHSLLTIRAAEKDQLASHIFDGSLTTEAIQQFISDYHIRYIIAYTWTAKLSQIPILTRLSSTQSLILYAVRK